MLTESDAQFAGQTASPGGFPGSPMGYNPPQNAGGYGRGQPGPNNGQFNGYNAGYQG